MSLRHGLLGLLNYMPMTGYELDKAFKDSLSFFWQANTSQVYRELNTMERRGWLTSEWIIQQEKPNKRVYSITEEGKSELMNWIGLSEADIYNAMHVKNAFLMRVFFAGEMSPKNSLVMLQSFRKSCLENIEHMKDAYEAISAYGAVVNHDQRTKYWEMTAIYGDEFLKAGLQWADKSIAILEEMIDEDSRT